MTGDPFGFYDSGSHFVEMCSNSGQQIKSISLLLVS